MINTVPVRIDYAKADQGTMLNLNLWMLGSVALW